jgi:hypothetical protein
MGVYSYGSALVPHQTDLAPTDGTTLAGVAERDDFLQDVLTGWTYRNTGTKASPVWTRYIRPTENRARISHRTEFGGGEQFYTLDVPLYSSTGANVIPTTATARGYVTVPKSGILSHAELVVEDALAVNGTNYVTVTVINRLASGSGSTAMLNAGSAYNTTFTGGTALPAKGAYPLEALTNPVNSGDVLEVLITVTGTLGAAIDGPVVKLRIQSVRSEWITRVYRIAGSPTVVENSGLTGITAYTDGNLYMSLSGTNEAQYAGVDWGYRLIPDMSMRGIFEARIKVNTNPATNSRICVGVSSPIQGSSLLADATFLDQMVSKAVYDPTALTNFAWFKLSASMALLYEGKVGSSSSLANSTGITLTTGQQVVLTIDFRTLSATRFLVGGALVGTLNLTDFSTCTPILFIQKDSGTNAPTMRTDYVDMSWDRTF